MALAWESDDGDGDDPFRFDFWAGLAAATVTDPLPGSLAERLAATRPAWQARAACRGRSDLSWFDDASEAAAVAVCSGCVVREACAAYGSREPAGVWGGRAPIPVVPVASAALEGLRLADLVAAGAATAVPPVRRRAKRSDAGKRKPPVPCVICDWRPARCKGRCTTCYFYLYRTGRDRPEELVVAAGRRAFDRQLAPG